MKLAVQVGINILDFWQMTPAEVNIVAEVYAEQEQLKHKERWFELYIQSLCTAKWIYAKKVPDFDKLYNKLFKFEIGIKEPKTDEQMLETVKMLNTIFGGDVEVVRKSE